MKKLISLITAVAMLSISLSALAWEGEEEYNLRKGMVGNHELNVYVLDNPEKAPYYGARLEPRSGVYFGTIAENTDEFEGYSTILTYVEFDQRQRDLYYPANSMVRNGNCNVMLAWNVTDTDTIRNIDAYTDYIERTAERFASYNKNFYIRFAAEMNDADLGSGEEYKYAFRKVADIVHQYDNLAMVWCPIGVGSLLKLYGDYYPGDEYVDWLGISSYQIQYFTGDRNILDEIKRVFMTGEYAWQTNSMKIMNKFMRDNNIQKPVMISEGGVANENIWGDSYEGWSDRRMRNMYWDVIMEYPQVKMINYFNTRMSWEKEFFDLDNKSALSQIVKEATDSGAYFKNGKSASGAFTRLENSGTLVGPEIEFFSHAYIMDADAAIEYRIEDMTASQSIAPYRAAFDISSLADGNHALSVFFTSQGGLVESKNYWFKKLGPFVRFGRGNIIENKTVNVSLNSSPVSFDVQPCVIADRTLVPIRLFANSLGIPDKDIIYNQIENSVTITCGRDLIKLYVNKPDVYVNGSKADIDVPATIIDGRTLVPVRFICENFGCTVDYKDSGDILDVYLKSN